MKTSALSLLTAAALMFATSSAAFAQEATSTTPVDPTTPAECLALQGAGATAPDESLVADQESDDDTESSTGEMTDSTDASGAVDDTTPADCPDLDADQ